MKDDYFVIDIVKKVSREELDNFEKKINEYIRQGINYTIRNYDEVIDSDVDLAGYDIELENLKLVVLEGVEKNICGGTHINNTKELKYLKIARYKYMGEKTRINAYIGNEAIDLVNKYFNEFVEIVKLVNRPEEEIYTVIENKMKESKKLAKQLKKMEKQLSDV